VRITRLQFALVAGLIITVTLLLAYVADVSAREAELRRQQAEAEIHALEAELRERQDRIDALEESITNRGGRAMLLLSLSGFSAADFERAFAVLGKTGMVGLGEAFVAAEAERGTNALALAAICALESGWGTSSIARGKNNLAGLGAYDDSPGRALRFDDRAECIMFLADLLQDRPGSLEEVGVWYASDPRWAEKVAGCMKIITEAGQ
jgi:beta-N-acetylglucosaminidase